MDEDKRVETVARALADLRVRQNILTDGGSKTYDAAFIQRAIDYGWESFRLEARVAVAAIDGLQAER